MYATLVISDFPSQIAWIFTFSFTRDGACNVCFLGSLDES